VLGLWNSGLIMSIFRPSQRESCHPDDWNEEFRTWNRN
jgi:hypothetical protein